MTDLLYGDVIDEGSVFHIKIPNTKTKIAREFYITAGSMETVNMTDIVRRYISLRPSGLLHFLEMRFQKIYATFCIGLQSGRFFVGFRQGVCIRQPVGINTLASMPKKIASFLNLPHVNEYTGHCFRRSSTSLLADSGADLLTVKRHGGWKSNSVAEGYIDTSTANKKTTAKKILGEKVPTQKTNVKEEFSSIKSVSSSSNHCVNSIQELSNSGIHFTFNIYKK